MKPMQNRHFRAFVRTSACGSFPGSFLLIFLIVSSADLGAAHASPPQREPAPFLARELPAGAYRAETFALGIPKALAGIQATFTENLVRKQAWVQAYLKRLDLKPGQTLPYDPEFGISREQYERLMQAYKQPAIAPQQTVQIEVSVSRGRTQLRAPAPLKSLDRYAIAADGTLTGPDGFHCSPERVTDRTALFGVWSGTSWNLETGDPEGGTYRSFELAIGRTRAGRTFLSLQDTQLADWKRVASDKVLTWLAKTGPGPATEDK